MKVILLESDNNGIYHVSTDEGNFCIDYREEGTGNLYNEHPEDGGVLVQELKTDILKAIQQYELKNDIDEDQVDLARFLTCQIL